MESRHGPHEYLALLWSGILLLFFISISGAIICYVLELLGCDFFLRAGDTKYQLLLFEKLSQILPMISVANLIVSVLVVFSARENEEIREYFAMSYYVVAFLPPLAISMLLAAIYILAYAGSHAIFHRIIKQRILHCSGYYCWALWHYMPHMDNIPRDQGNSQKVPRCFS